MTIGELLELRAYADDVARIIAYIVAIASVIVRLTPNLRDNAVLLPIIKFISKYIAVNRCTKDDLLRKIKEK